MTTTSQSQVNYGTQEQHLQKPVVKIRNYASYKGGVCMDLTSNYQEKNNHFDQDSLALTIFWTSDAEFITL